MAVRSSGGRNRNLARIARDCRIVRRGLRPALFFSPFPGKFGFGKMAYEYIKINELHIVNGFSFFILELRILTAPPGLLGSAASSGILNSRIKNMARRSTQQIVLKPQDLYLLLALLINTEKQPTYAQLAARTGLAASAVHASLKRAVLAGLAAIRDGNASVLRPQLKEFVLGGAKYAFPAVLGRISRGVPTAYAAEPLKSVIAPSSDPVPVWPHRAGKTRGVSLAPLYPTVPEAASRDANLYALLALFDAYRSGQARERAAAQKLLEKYFSARA